MLKPEEVTELVGHQIGGVCPFGVKPGTEVYLDVSIRRFDKVYRRREAPTAPSA